MSQHHKEPDQEAHGAQGTQGGRGGQAAAQEQGGAAEAKEHSGAGEDKTGLECIRGVKNNPKCREFAIQMFRLCIFFGFR